MCDKPTLNPLRHMPRATGRTVISHHFACEERGHARIGGPPGFRLWCPASHIQTKMGGSHVINHPHLALMGIYSMGRASSIWGDLYGNIENCIVKSSTETKYQRFTCGSWLQSSGMGQYLWYSNLEDEHPFRPSIRMELAILYAPRGAEIHRDMSMATASILCVPTRLNSLLFRPKPQDSMKGAGFEISSQTDFLTRKGHTKVCIQRFKCQLIVI